jgi:hypothetical protein
MIRAFATIAMCHGCEDDGSVEIKPEFKYRKIIAQDLFPSWALYLRKGVNQVIPN